MKITRTIRLFTLSALAILSALVLCACMSGLPGAEDLPKPTATPTMTPTPTPIPPTSTPTPSPEPTGSPTPTPIPPTPTPDVTTMRDGGYNAMAIWDEDGTLLKTAPVYPGSMIYANNFERDQGNRSEPSNTCNNAEVYTTDSISSSGHYSVKVSRRKQEYHGLSGFCLRLNEVNGLSYESLVGKTICLRCKIYYEDEGFGSPAEKMVFTAFDTYHKEKVLDYVYSSRDGSRKTDKNGNYVMEKQDRFVRCNSVTVPRGEWTECVFYITVTETKAEDGGILIGTTDEFPNSVGLYCSYYIDDLTVSTALLWEIPVEPVEETAEGYDDAGQTNRPLPDATEATEVIEFEE